MIKVVKFDEVYIRILTDRSIDQELSDFFKYQMPGAKFSPQYKAKIWDGYIRLFNLSTKKIYAGLVNYVIEFAKRNDYSIEVEEGISYNNDISLETIEGFTNVLKLSSKGNPIEIRDYQIEAIHKAVNENRTLLISPTSSGKSLIIYSILRWHIAQGRKCLILCPTTSLVVQLYSDFEDYSSVNGWSTEANCQKLYSGFSKELTTNCMISTWQSITPVIKSGSTKGSKYTKKGKIVIDQSTQEFMESFDVVIIDECHLATGKSLTTIMEHLPHVKYRVGTTGTVQDETISQLQLEGVIGPMHRVTTTKALMDSGRVVNLDIKCLLLKHPDETRKIMSGAKYQDEIKFIIGSETRNRFITNLAVTQRGTTLVLFSFIAHGKKLLEMISANVTNQKVFYIAGEIGVDERESIRQQLAIYPNSILIASFNTCSTGISIPAIENIIFANPSKSKIRNLQSIGRGLRLKDGKDSATLYDISDDLSYKKATNFGLTHLAERIKIYSKEEFKFKLFNINIE